MNARTIGSSYLPARNSAGRLDDRIPALLKQHPAVIGVRLVGSRAEGRSHERSDWDFVVETSDFDAVATALPSLMQPLGCLSQQWDPLSPDWVWMLMLPGPIKVDLVIVGRPHAFESAYVPSAQNLEAIDMHFWDWMLWLRSKPLANRELHETELKKLFVHLLAPLGVESVPGSVGEAVVSYVDARSRAEARLGVKVPRSLEEEVAPALKPFQSAEQVHRPRNNTCRA